MTKELLFQQLLDDLHNQSLPLIICEHNEIATTLTQVQLNATDFDYYNWQFPDSRIRNYSDFAQTNPLTFYSLSKSSPNTLKIIEDFKLKIIIYHMLKYQNTNFPLEKFKNIITQVFQTQGIKINALLTQYALNSVFLLEFSKSFSLFLKKQNFLSLKKSWYSVLQRRLPNTKLFLIAQYLYYEDVFETKWNGCIDYLVKFEEKELILDVLGMKKFGVSLNIEKIINVFRYIIRNLTLSSIYSLKNLNNRHGFSKFFEVEFKNIFSTFMKFVGLFEERSIIRDHNRSKILNNFIKRQVMYELLLSYSNNLYFNSFNPAFLKLRCKKIKNLLFQLCGQMQNLYHIFFNQTIYAQKVKGFYIFTTLSLLLISSLVSWILLWMFVITSLYTFYLF